MVDVETECHVHMASSFFYFIPTAIFTIVIQSGVQDNYIINAKKMQSSRM